MCIHIQTEELVFALAKVSILSSVKTAPMCNSGHVFTLTNLQPLALAKFQFFSLNEYSVEFLRHLVESERFVVSEVAF